MKITHIEADMKLNAFSPLPEDDDELHLPELVYWASLGDIAEVEQSLTYSDVNTMDEEGYSALHAAAENDHLEVVKLLVQRGADVNYKAQYSALELAEMAGNSEIVAYLKSV
ncbi:MAG TPA: ankyrin repeat domain-containing protein [Flavobacterium sp.]|jgi:ankyrin repeat protein|nr:ankyrin repeat domain-containing protein [Flavobacterium sp.]